MKKFRRILSAFLAVIMVLGTVTVVGAANVSFTDVSGHWAWTGGQIPYLVDKGVLNGYKQPNGTYLFKPDGEITRAEFIKILDETFGLTATASISFKDVSTFSKQFKRRHGINPKDWKHYDRLKQNIK